VLGELKSRKHLLNVYIGDENKEIEGKNLYILTLASPTSNMNKVLEWARDHHLYVADYEIGEAKDMLHMMIFRCPNEHAYDMFMISRYSKMYQKKDLDEFRKARLPAYEVLGATEKARQKVIKELELHKDWKAAEYDSVWTREEEIFQTERVKRNGIQLSLL